MAVPTTEVWRSIAEKFEERFPLCSGVLDGKHVAPDNSGSQFFYYKGTFSLVLLAVVDAHYSFWVINFRGYGRTSSGGILASVFGQMLWSSTLVKLRQSVTSRQSQGYYANFTLKLKNFKSHDGALHGIFPLPNLRHPQCFQHAAQQVITSLRVFTMTLNVIAPPPTLASSCV